MSKNPLVILLTTLGVLLLLLAIKMPIAEWLRNTGHSEFVSNHVGGAIARFMIVAWAIFTIVRCRLIRINGIYTPLKISDFYVAIIPLSLLLWVLYGKLDIYGNADLSSLTVFIVSALAISAAEELIFRGVILPILIRHLKMVNGAIIISAILFGLVHYINLFKQPDNFYGVTSQVLFAISLGVVFGAIFLRTGNIFVVILLHLLFNLAFGGSTELDSSLSSSDGSAPASHGLVWPSLIFTLVFYVLIGGLGLLAMYNANKPAILTKVGHEQ